MKLRSSLLLFAPMILACVPPYARAGEGVIEINQARALAGQVTAGDLPGFPVTLTRRGSYALTSDLDVRGLPNGDELSAVVIEADGVSIDLKGFGLIGSVRCTGNPPNSPVSCSPSGLLGTGVLVAVDGLGNGYMGARVSNGRIEGFTRAGVFCFAGCIVDRIEVRHNEGNGISVGDGSTVRDSVAELNAAAGVSGTRTVLASSMLVRNGGVGANLGPGSLVFDTVASRNAGVGIFSFVDASDGSSVVGYRACSFTNNNGGNLNGQVGGTGLIALGSNICGTDTTCP